MNIGVITLLVLVLSAAIWIFIEFQRLKHKIFAIFLVVLILFMYASFYYVFKDKDINYGTISGIMEATDVYLAWLGSVSVNLVKITSNAIQMDWGLNETSSKSPSK